MSRKHNPRARIDAAILTFSIAAIVGIAATAVAEDIRYFAAGSPESFLHTWRIQPLSMFAGSVVFVATLYLLQLLNDRPRALNYVFPYLPLLLFSGIDLAVRLNPLWVAGVAVACFGFSVLQIRYLHGG